MLSLEGLANRGYTEGFLRRHTHDEYQNYQSGSSVSDHQQFVGEILGWCPDTEMAIVDVKNKFCVGHQLELMTPDGNLTFELQYMIDYKSNTIDNAKGSGHQVRIPVPHGVSLDYALLLRNLEENQTTRRPFDTAPVETA